jgi:hypothetical protein
MLGPNGIIETIPPEPGSDLGRIFFATFEEGAMTRTSPATEEKQVTIGCCEGSVGAGAIPESLV